MKLSDKIRSLLSAWMAGYAQPLVEECADHAEALEAVAKAASRVSRAQTPETWQALDDALDHLQELSDAE